VGHNRWFPGDRSTPEFEWGWAGLADVDEFAGAESLTFDLSGQPSLTIVFRKYEGSYHQFVFSDVADVVFDGTLQIGRSADGIEVEEVARIVGKQQFTVDGRVVYFVNFVEATLTFSCRSVNRSPLSGPIGH
jgi:hypothetical protein